MISINQCFDTSASYFFASTNNSFLIIAYFATAFKDFQYVDLVFKMKSLIFANHILDVMTGRAVLKIFFYSSELQTSF